LEDLLDGLDDFMTEELPWLFVAVKESHGEAAVARRREEERTESRRSYDKPFKRRLHVVEFVADRALPLSALLHRTLDDTGGKRLPWRGLSAEWNKMHPYDQMTPAALRRTYWRAKREGRLRAVYFEQALGDYSKVFEKAQAYVQRTLSKLIAAGGGHYCIPSLAHVRPFLIPWAKRLRPELLAELLPLVEEEDSRAAAPERGRNLRKRGKGTADRRVGGG
jgi:hypothetical protein